MKRMTTVIALALAALFFAYNRASQAVTPQASAVKRVQVTTQTIAAQRGGEAYVLDFTRGGTVYEINTGIDFNRVNVRTEAGVRPLSELARSLKLSGKFLLGSGNDLQAIGFGFPTGGSVDLPVGVVEAKCQGALCTCTGRKDCNDLTKAKWCGGKASWACGAGYGTHSTNWGCVCPKA
jgi:hypothetical protein